MLRGGPTIARPVTAAGSEHPKSVLHSNKNKTKQFQPLPMRPDVHWGSKANRKGPVIAVSAKWCSERKLEGT